jgi:hypothetical protein
MVLFRHLSEDIHYLFYRLYYYYYYSDEELTFSVRKKRQAVRLSVRKMQLLSVNAGDLHVCSPNCYKEWGRKFTVGK